MQESVMGAGRVRWSAWAPVRLVAYGAGVMATVIVATILTRLLVPAAPSPWHGLVLLKTVLLPIAMFWTYASLVRLMERRPAEEVDLRKGAPALLVGALVGSALIGAFVIAMWALGLVRISGGTGLDGLAGEILVPLLTATVEEMLFRVILFGILQEVFGSAVAILVSALLFGLAHAGNPGATPTALAALSMELGVLLALAYILTGNIWLAVGLHMGWNFAEGFVFGLLNSGVRDPDSLLRTSLTGPDLLTGGAFGPEGSMILLGLALAVSASLYAQIRRQGRWRSPRFRLRLGV